MQLVKVAWASGLDVFLYDGKLNARRSDGPLTDRDKSFLTKHKDELIKELNSYSTRTRTGAAEFFGAIYRERFPEG